MKKTMAIVLALFVSLMTMTATADNTWTVLTPEWWNAPTEKLIEARDQINYQLSLLGVESPANPSSTSESPDQIEKVTTASNTNEEPIIEVNSSEDYVLIQEFKWSETSRHYWGIVVKNLSSEDKEFSVQIMLFDKNNGLIGAKNDSCDACSPGGMVYLGCSNDAEFDHVEYSVTSSTTRNGGVQSNIEVSGSLTEKKAVIIAKNVSDFTMKFVKYTVLFVDDLGNVVKHGTGYLVDGDSEIKPGKTEMREATCSSRFTNAYVFLDGRY